MKPNIYAYNAKTKSLNSLLITETIFEHTENVCGIPVYSHDKETFYFYECDSVLKQKIIMELYWKYSIYGGVM